MITVWVDEITPCLKLAKTGEMVDTEVVRIKRKSFLQNYNSRNGWYTNWAKLAGEYEIFALVIKGTMDIQGLVAMKDNKDAGCAYVDWICANPESNPLLNDEKKYIGIGGHLFAIASDRSNQYGYGGEFYGFAANEKLLHHYIETFGVTYIGMLHDYHFILEDVQAKKILEEYTYEWTDEEI